MYAIVPPGPIWALPALVSGLTTCVTCGACWSDLTVAFTTEALCWSVIVPLFTRRTTGFEPFAWEGNAARASRAPFGCRSRAG